MVTSLNLAPEASTLHALISGWPCGQEFGVLHNFSHSFRNLSPPALYTHTHTHKGMEKLKATLWKCKQTSCSSAEVTECILKELFPFIFLRVSLLTCKCTSEMGVGNRAVPRVVLTHRKEENPFQSPKDRLAGAGGHPMLARLHGLGTRFLSSLLRCTSSGGQGSLETLTLTGEEKDVACTSHRINTLNSRGGEADANMCNVEQQT